jgi:hypothetical protein
MVSIPVLGRFVPVAGHFFRRQLRQANYGLIAARSSAEVVGKYVACHDEAAVWRAGDGMPCGLPSMRAACTSARRGKVDEHAFEAQAPGGERREWPMRRRRAPLRPTVKSPEGR